MADWSASRIAFFGKNTKRLANSENFAEMQGREIPAIRISTRTTNSFPAEPQYIHPSMQKKSSQSGLFNPRIFLAFLLCTAGVSLALLSLDARPSRSTSSQKSSSVATRATTNSASQVATTPGMPRYYTYAPGPGIGESAGEPSIGFNPISGRVMYLSNTQTLRATLPENIPPLGSVPSACNADWLDVSYTTTQVRSVDPILFTDQVTGRTFVSELNTITQTSPALIGLNSLMAYTDDDGATWTPAQVNPPDGSNDHQTVGGGAISGGPFQPEQFGQQRARGLLLRPGRLRFSDHFRRLLLAE